MLRSFVDPGLFSRDPADAMYRPLVVSSYVLNHLIGGQRPAIYHATNVAIHVLAAWLVLLIGQHLWSWRAGLAPAVHSGNLAASGCSVRCCLSHSSR